MLSCSVFVCTSFKCALLHQISTIQVIYIGQPVGMVVAKSETAAREAAKWLQEHAITYIDLQGMVSLDEAIEKKRFFYDKTTCESAPSRLLKVSYAIFS